MNSLVICSNVLRRMLREKSSFIFLALLPLVAGGLIMVITVERAPEVFVVGASITPADSPVVAALVDLPEYGIEVMAEDELKLAVTDKRLTAGIVAHGEGAVDRLTLYALADNPDIQRLASIIDALASGYEVQQDMSIAQDSAYQRPRMSLGFLTLFMLLFVGGGVGLLLEDKKSRTFMRTFCAPVKEYQVVLGHLLANLVLGLLQIGLFLVVAQFILKIQWGAAPASIFMVLAVFLVAVIGLAIGIAGFVQDPQTHNVVLTLVAMPTTLLGGGFFPLEMLPKSLQQVGLFIPQRWVMEAFSALYSGANIFEVGTHLLIITVFGLVLFTFGTKALTPTAGDL